MKTLKRSSTNAALNKASKSDLRKLSSFLQKRRKKAAISLRQFLAALGELRFIAMIDKEELHNINYAVSYFQNFLSESEKTALSAFVMNVSGLGEDKVAIHLKGGVEPSDEVKELLKDGMQLLRKRLAKKLLSEYRDEIYANSCTKCGKLPKTPKARMCTWCGHSWFE